MHTLHDGLSDVTYVLLPVLAQAFGLSLAQVGLVRAAQRTAMAAFQIPAGLIAERFGERNLLAFGTLCAGLAFIGLGFAPGFYAILFALFWAGFGSAVQHPLASSIISHAYPGEGRRAALGTYNFFGDVGKFAFGGAASLLFVAGVGWQAPVLVFGLLGIAAAIAISLLVPNSRDSTITTGQIKPAAKAAGWGIRDKQGFTALCLIDVLDSSTRSGFLTLVAFLMIASGLPDGWAAMSVPLILIGGMAGKLACGLLAERFGIVRMVVITEIATGCGILATLVLPTLGAFLLLPLVGVVLNGTSSVLYGTIGDFVDKDRLPRAFGAIYTVGSVCGIASPLGYGFLGDLYGVETAIALMGVLIFLTVPMAFMLRPGRAARLESV
ncbi:MAG: MFS transporter [Betaproteobacteria bacterium]|nr:MFS transporter [Betaproteobacteria bacterium]MDH3438201.1 MFS transporter [Betaproteobacteria bacterium]